MAAALTAPCCKLLALPRTEKFSTIAARLLRLVRSFVGGGTDGAWSEAFRGSTDGAWSEAFRGGTDGAGSKAFRGGTDGAGSEASRWRHCRRLVRSLSVEAPTAPGQKLFGGGTDGAGSEAFRWRH